MGLLTAIRKFRYPVSTDAFNPPLDLKNLADDVDAWTGNQLTPLVIDNNDRDAKYPTPAQGQSAFRRDYGYEERYFEALSAGNPGGANPAGWYPVGGGQLPFYRAQAGGSAQNVPSGQATVLTNAIFPPDVASNTQRKLFQPAAAGVLTVPMSGWYEIEYQCRFSYVGGGAVAVTLNSNTYAGFILRVEGNFPSLFSSKQVQLTAGDQLRFWALQSSGGQLAINANKFDTFFNVVYMGPPTAPGGF